MASHENPVEHLKPDHELPPNPTLLPEFTPAGFAEARTAFKLMSGATDSTPKQGSTGEQSPVILAGKTYRFDPCAGRTVQENTARSCFQET
jgi:hypothetical protein